MWRQQVTPELTVKLWTANAPIQDIGVLQDATVVMASNGVMWKVLEVRTQTRIYSDNKQQHTNKTERERGRGREKKRKKESKKKRKKKEKKRDSSENQHDDIFVGLYRKTLGRWS